MISLPSWTSSSNLLRWIFASRTPILIGFINTPVKCNYNSYFYIVITLATICQDSSTINSFNCMYEWRKIFCIYLNITPLILVRCLPFWLQIFPDLHRNGIYQRSKSEGLHQIWILRNSENNGEVRLKYPSFYIWQRWGRKVKAIFPGNTQLATI